MLIYGSFFVHWFIQGAFSTPKLIPVYLHDILRELLIKMHCPIKTNKAKIGCNWHARYDTGEHAKASTRYMDIWNATSNDDWCPTDLDNDFVVCEQNQSSLCVLTVSTYCRFPRPRPNRRDTPALHRTASDLGHTDRSDRQTPQGRTSSWLHRKNAEGEEDEEEELWGWWEKSREHHLHHHTGDLLPSLEPCVTLITRLIRGEETHFVLLALSSPLSSANYPQFPAFSSRSAIVPLTLLHLRCRLLLYKLLIPLCPYRSSETDADHSPAREGWGFSQGLTCFTAVSDEPERPRSDKHLQQWEDWKKGERVERVRGSIKSLFEHKGERSKLLASQSWAGHRFQSSLAKVREKKHTKSSAVELKDQQTEVRAGPGYRCDCHYLSFQGSNN